MKVSWFSEVSKSEIRTLHWSRDLAPLPRVSFPSLHRWSCLIRPSNYPLATLECICCVYRCIPCILMLRYGLCTVQTGMWYRYVHRILQALLNTATTVVLAEPWVRFFQCMYKQLWYSLDLQWCVYKCRISYYMYTSQMHNPAPNCSIATL